MTSKAKFSSQQVWEGNRPHVFNLVLKFYALYDAKKEVMDALQALEEMASPQVNNVAPGGRIPYPVTCNIGRVALYPECVIAAISTPLDKETLTMLNRSDISRTFGA